VKKNPKMFRNEIKDGRFIEKFGTIYEQKPFIASPENFGAARH
jgi:2-oxo-4-hydroxy-4-carboxy--5-ureidoimidazoline (OHCU) decarboxylase